MSHHQAVDGRRPESRLELGTGTQCCYHLEYVVTESESAHEPWLFEWVLDCLEHEDVDEISVSRDIGRSLGVSILIRTLSACQPDPTEENDLPRFDELERRVEGLSVHCVEFEPVENAMP